MSRPSSHLILCHPLLLPPSVFPSSQFSSVSVIMLNDNISRLVVGKQAFTWLLKCQADVEKICYLLPTVMWSSLGKWGAPWGREVWTMQGPGTDVACGQEVLVWAKPWRVTPIWEVFGKGKARVKSQESRGQQLVWVAWWASAGQQGDWCLRQTCSRSPRGPDLTLTVLQFSPFPECKLL